MCSGLFRVWGGCSGLGAYGGLQGVGCLSGCFRVGLGQDWLGGAFRMRPGWVEGFFDVGWARIRVGLGWFGV